LVLEGLSRKVVARRLGDNEEDKEFRRIRQLRGSLSISLRQSVGKTRTAGHKGFTLIEMLFVVNIVAILVGIAAIISSEHGSESRCVEIYRVLPQIIRSQSLHYMNHQSYFAASHDELEEHGVDVSETGHFSYSTLPDEVSSFLVRAETKGWAPGGWVVYTHKGDPTWSCDGVMIKTSWLPR
jgi:prepilin-type N-terminal cleavage/methylation domain-containing protein